MSMTTQQIVMIVAPCRSVQCAFESRSDLRRLSRSIVLYSRWVFVSVGNDIKLLDELKGGGAFDDIACLLCTVVYDKQSAKEV